MKNTNLYAELLGLKPPWSVQSVALKVAEDRVEVEVACAETVWGCPECRQRMHGPAGSRYLGGLDLYAEFIQ